MSRHVLERSTWVEHLFAIRLTHRQAIFCHDNITRFNAAPENQWRDLSRTICLIYSIK